MKSVNRSAKLACSSFLTCIGALCYKKYMRSKLWSGSLISHPRKGKHVENYCSCAPQVQNAYSVFEQGLIFHQDKWLLFQLLKGAAGIKFNVRINFPIVHVFALCSDRYRVYHPYHSMRGLWHSCSTFLVITDIFYSFFKYFCHGLSTSMCMLSQMI